MAVKTPRVRGPFRLVLYIFALSLLCPVLLAEPESGYYTVPGPGGIQFIQRLVWPKNENASQYELEVERREAQDAAAIGPEYTGVYRVITKEVSAEFSLSPGDYRYRVILYNLLRQPEYAAAWVEFVILRALQPELSGFSPRRLVLKRDAALELVLEGSNLVPGTEIRLERRGRSILPSGYHPDPSGERAFLIYDAPDLSAGNYTIRVTNPGGLEASLPDFMIKSSSPSFQVLLAYAPVLPASGYVFELFTDPFHPVGFELYTAWLPFKAAWGTLGLEAAFGWSYLKGQQNSADLSAHFGELGLNLLYRRELGSYFAFKARAGAGSGGMLNLVFDYGGVQSNPYNTLSPMADLGVSIEWLMHHSFYAELGVNGFLAFSKDTPQPLYLRPFIGAGWRY